MDKAIKMNLSKPVKSEFTRISDKILAYIKQITPHSEKLSTFGIHSYDDKSADTFKVYYDNGVLNAGTVENFTWKDLEDHIPELKDFIQKYSLGKSFTLAAGEDVPPHRHYYTLDSMWSISMFRGKSNGTIKFFNNKNKVGAQEQKNYSHTYDDWVCVEEITSQPGDFYSLKTWNWHGWKSHDPNLNSYCTIFYMNNTTTYKSALAAIKHIEQY